MNARRLRLTLAAVAIGLVAVGAVLAAGRPVQSRSGEAVSGRRSRRRSADGPVQASGDDEQVDPGQRRRACGRVVRAGHVDGSARGVRPARVSEEGRPALEPEGGARRLQDGTSAGCTQLPGRVTRGLGSRWGRRRLSTSSRRTGTHARTSRRSTRQRVARPTSRSTRTAAGTRRMAATTCTAGCGSRQPAEACGARRTPSRRTRTGSTWAGSFGINAAGLDRDSTRTIRAANTLWVGTGEGNACGSGCVAGVGLYKSTDGGDHWTGPYGNSVFNARGVGTIRVKPGDPNTIYAGSAFAVRGHSSVCCYGGIASTAR